MKSLEWGIGPDCPVIGIVGMLAEIKGHRYFLEAASFVAAKRPDARFVVIGDGEIRNALQQLAVSLGIARQVLFVGHQEDMPARTRTQWPESTRCAWAGSRASKEVLCADFRDR